MTSDAVIDPAVFSVVRTFDAPRKLVWNAHAELDHLKKWWGPKAGEWVAGTMDFRPGGMFHYGMRLPNGQMMWGRLAFREIVPEERMVSVLSFSDEHAGITRHPLSAEWPLEVLITAVFAEQGGKTSLSLTGRPINATEAEIRAYTAGHQSMQQGFGATLDQLAAHLAQCAS